MSLKQTILSVTRRTKNGFTVGEIFDRVESKLGIFNSPLYSTVRARVYELARSGELLAKGVRKDPASNFNATTFARN